MHSAPRPGTTEVGHQVSLIQFGGDFRFPFAVLGELFVDPADKANLVLGTWNENDSVGLKALLFTSAQQTFLFPSEIDEHPPQSEAWRPALPISEFDQTALSLEDLGGQFAAVFAGHGPFDALDDC